MANTALDDDTQRVVSSGLLHASRRVDDDDDDEQKERRQRDRETETSILTKRAL